MLFIQYITMQLFVNKIIFILKKKKYLQFFLISEEP